MEDLAQKLLIRPIHPDDSLEELTEFLHHAYRSLADMGLRFVATYQSVEVTAKRIKKGFCFLAELDGKLVGTFSVHGPQPGFGSPWECAEGHGRLSQLGVDPALQRQGIGERLMKFAEGFAREQGMIELTIDTAEEAKHLIAWYDRMGYRFIEFQDWEVTNYRSVVMSKKLNGSSE